MFCNYRESPTLSNIVGSFIQQIFRDKSLPEEFHAIYSKYSNSRMIPTEADLFRLLGTLLDQFRVVYIVIDALDEYQQNGRRKLVNQLRNLSVNLNLLCTSWPLGDIAEIFQDATRLQIRATVEDISAYLQVQILETDLLGRFCGRDPSLQNVILATISTKADGM